MPKKLSREIFIKKAENLYGRNRFDYSKVVYKNFHTKVIIGCKSDGEWFLIRPDSHLRPKNIELGGCPICLKKWSKEIHGKKMREKYSSSKEKFIKKAKSIWGNRFDYSKVIYFNNRTKVEIKCLRHKHIFFVAPYAHTANNKRNGPGCIHCKRDKIIDALSFTHDQYVQICNEVHNFKYKYKNQCYSGSNNKIDIYCQIHGWFKQIANDHRNGSECPKCSKARAAKKISLSREDFINRSEIIHNFKYDYKLVEYKNTRSKVKIICTNKNHGIFEQIAQLHLEGRGCQKCSRIEQSLQQLKTTQEFVERANKIHQNKYSYSNTEYFGARIPVRIDCKIHGEFYQVPNYHLSGNGCQKCGNEAAGYDGIINFLKSENWASQKCFLYFVNVGEFSKIGIAKNIKKRARSGHVKYGIIKSWELYRVQAWLVEQVLLRLTLKSKPEILPEEFIYWRGRNELRIFNDEQKKDLIKRANAEVNIIKTMDWIDYASLKEISQRGIGWN